MRGFQIPVCLSVPLRQVVPKASSMSDPEYLMIHSWKGLYEYYSVTETEIFFLEIFGVLVPLPFSTFPKASSISGLQHQVIHHWKGLEDYYVVMKPKFQFRVLWVLNPPSQNFQRLQFQVYSTR